MASDFYTDYGEIRDESRVVISGASDSRYAYYKTRRYGKLLFVKALNDISKGDLVAEQALRKEFVIGYQLDHPNLIRYLHHEDGAVYEEYVEGLTLRQLIDGNDRRLNDKDFVADVVRQVLSALKYMHQQGVLHLDVKPENIMITKIGDTVKLLDLGCAYTSSLNLTPGFTFNYKAPEQGTGEINTYTDIYQLGRVIDEIVKDKKWAGKWNRFIKRSTAPRPSDRFENDDIAMAAIPRRRKISKSVILNVALVTILIVVSAAMFLMRREVATTSPGVSVVDTLKQIIKVETPVAEMPSVAPPRAVSEQPQDIRLTIQKAIHDKVDNYYNDNIRRWCANAPYNEESQVLLGKKIMKSLDDMRPFITRLSAQYPEHSDFIESEFMSRISSQSNLAGMWLSKTMSGQEESLRPDNESKNTQVNHMNDLDSLDTNN